MTDLITAEQFLASASGLSEAQRSGIEALRTLGPRAAERWASIAETFRPPLPAGNATLPLLAGALGLDATDVAFLTGRFGSAERPVTEWAALAAAYLRRPDGWNARCAPRVPSQTSGGGGTDLAAIPGEGYLRREGASLQFEPLDLPDPLPDGEGFFERDQGDVKATPLLRAQGGARVLREARLDGYPQAPEGAFARQRPGGLAWTPLLMRDPTKVVATTCGYHPLT